MARECLDIVIRIERQSADGYGVSVRAPGGDAAAQFVPPSRMPLFQEALRRIVAFETDETLLRHFGQLLFEALFTPAIRTVYARTQGMRAGNQALRLVLDIDPEATEIAALPWEYLVDPDQGPLVMLDTPVVRYLPLSAAVPALATPLPLKVLLTGAATPPKVDVAAELRAIETAISKTLGERAAVVVEPRLTRTILQRRLREGCHVWHFVGHGGLARDVVTSVLWLEDEVGDPEPVSAPELAVLLKGCEARLVVLNACGSGALRTDPFRSIAPALIRAEVPAVIAMQSSVAADTTRAFATGFYQALAEGLLVDACVTEGRKAVLGVVGLGSPDWGAPVVFTRARDGRLFTVPPPPSPRLLFEPSMALIPSGTFLMGRAPAPGVPVEETPQHLVALPAFRISVRPVSNREYAAFVRETGRLVRPEMLWNGQNPPHDQLDQPVSGVSFADAVAYCAWLSERTQRSYRLPNEAEWERAASAAQEFGIAWGQVPEWTCTLWGERMRAPDPAFAYPWRNDERNDVAAGAHLRRVIRGLRDANGTPQVTARSSAAPDQFGPPGGRYGFRVVEVIGS